MPWMSYCKCKPRPLWWRFVGWTWNYESFLFKVSEVSEVKSLTRIRINTFVLSISNFVLLLFQMSSSRYNVLHFWMCTKYCRREAKDYKRRSVSHGSAGKTTPRWSVVWCGWPARWTLSAGQASSTQTTRRHTTSMSTGRACANSTLPPHRR